MQLAFDKLQVGRESECFQTLIISDVSLFFAHLCAF
jgi:hypothetical protein